MNTKGIKFLAVLAVMVMAFSAIVVLAPADIDADDIKVYSNPDVIRNPEIITKDTKKTQFYFSDDASVKITGIPGSNSNSVGTIDLFVQNGKELEINIKPEAGSDGKIPDKLAGTINVWSVTADQQRVTTSTINDEPTDPVKSTGKVILITEYESSLVSFTGLKGQTVVYKAMMPSPVNTYTTSDVNEKKVVKTDIYTYYSYATVSADKTLTSPYIGAMVQIAPGQYIEVDESDDTNEVYASFGIYIEDKETPAANSTYTYYAAGGNAGTFEMNDAGDKVVVYDGTINVKNGTASAKATSAYSNYYYGGDGITITNAGSDEVGVSGDIWAGTITLSGAVSFPDNGTFDVVATDYTYGTVIINNKTEATGNVDVEGKVYIKTDHDGIKDVIFTGEDGIIYAQNPKLWQFDNTPASMQGRVDPLPYILGTIEGEDEEATFIDSDFCGLIDTSAINETATVTDRFASAVIERNQTFRVIGDVVVTTSLTVNGILIIDEGASVTISKSQKTGAVIQVDGQYGQLINNGKISVITTADPAVAPIRDIGLHIHGGYAENNGMISANSEIGAVKYSDVFPTVCSNFYSVDPDTGEKVEAKGIGFVNNGTMGIGPNDTVVFDDNFVNNGSMTVNGRFSSGEFTNSGIFTLNSAKIIGDVLVTLTPLSTFIINSAEIEAYYEGATVQADGAITVTNGLDVIEITATATSVSTETETPFISVRGVTITDVSGLLFHGLDLYGSAGVNKVGSTDGYATMYMGGNITVADNALIGERVALKNYTYEDEETQGTITMPANLYVPGNFTVSKRNAIITSPAAAEDPIDGINVTVQSATGLITDIDNRLNVAEYLSARYVLPSDGTTFYTSLENAVPAAHAANINAVDVGKVGNKYPTLLTDLTIPAGMFVNGSGLNIGDEDNAPVVTVKAASSFNFNDIYLYEGQILADNANDVNESTIHADVKLINTTTYSGNFMSLRVAIKEMPGQTIYLSQDFESISRDLTIPAGTTVVAVNDDTEDKYFTMIDSNLVVDGTLIVYDFWFIATTNDEIGITVNGTIMDKHSEGECFDGWWYMPEGVSYQLTLPDKYGNDETWFVITSLDYLQESIDVADESKVNIEGSPKLGDISVHGSDDEPAEITFKGDVNAKTITMDNVIIKAKDGHKVTATFADALGAITITGAYVDDKLSIYSLGDKGVYMAGAVTDNEKGTYSIRFDGLTGIDGTTKSTIGWGNYYQTVKKEGEPDKKVTIATPSILFNGVTTSVGKKAVISNTNLDAEEPLEGMVTITGILAADNSNKIVMNTDVEVLGGLYAAERTETATAGSIEIYGDLFVGAYKSDVFNSQDAIDAYKEDGDEASYKGYGHYMYDFTPQQNAAAAAVVSGNVTVDDKHFITVLAGSDVSGIKYIDDLESMDIIIEGDLWITVYGTDKYSMDGLKAPIFNAKVDKILDIYGNEVAKFSNKYKVIYGSPALDLGDTGIISISLNYEAFTVTIKTDGSVKAVYIDDILMYTGENRNTFELDNITAGETHKVKVEAATGYDADKCILYTDMGTILPGMSFIFSETDCIYDEDGFNTYNIVYNINGTEIQPEPVPPTPEEESQWTITTILLVILVVLIAIMAVIVALRLNRS